MEQSDPESRIKELELELSNLKASIKATTQTEKAMQESKERKNAVEALKESQNLLQKAENISNQGSWKWDVINDEWYFSENWLKIHGFEKSKISKEELMEIAHPDDTSKINIAFDNALRNKKPYLLEHRIIRNDNGEVRVIKAVGEVHFLDNGKPDFMIGVAQDITESKVLEDAVKKSEAKHSAMISNISDVIGIIGTDGLMKYKSPNIEKHFGWQPQDLIGTNGFSNIHPDDLERIQEEFFTLLEKKNSSVTVEYRYKCKDGSYKPIELTAKNLVSDPVINGVLLNYHDITERKQTDKSLRSSQEMLLSSQSVANICSYSTNLNPTEINKSCWECSPEFYKIFGIDETYPHTIEGWIGFLHPEYRKDMAAYHESVVLEKKSFNREYKIIRINDGVERWVQGTGELEYDEKGNPIRMYGAIQDITERKQQELQLQKRTKIIENKNKELIESEIKLKQSDRVFNLTLDMFCIAGFDGYFKYLNPAWERTLGWSIEELQSKPWLDFVHPDDAENTENIKSVIVGGKEVYIFENRYICKDGSIRWFSWNSQPFPEENIMIGAVRDITEKKEKEAELIKAKEKAEESDRLKSAFLANMSHEIRTPMNGILGFSKLLKKPDLTGEQQQHYIEIIGQSGKRMLDTINSIIDISKIEAGLESAHITELNVNQQTKSLYEFFKPMAEGKGLHFSLANGLSTHAANINTDSGKFNSVLTNLVGNAFKFTEKGSIKFGYENKGEYIEFYVKDTGIGIPKDRVDAIFERFVQADIEDERVFEGSGLGLTISKSYVEMLGGKMWVESLEGKGTTFYFTLPYNIESKDKTLIDNAASEKGKEVKTNPNITRLNILVAEDDDVSFILLTNVLDEMSSKVIRAITGKEVVTLCSDNPDIDLILMDIKMPDMNGYEATAEIRKFNKEVVVIAQTAYGLAGDREKALDAGCNDYISKPIDEDKLFELINKYF